MSKFIKGLLIDELQSRFEGVSDFVVVGIDGITGTDNNQLRGQLLEKGIRLAVVKNNLMREAMKEMGHEGCAQAFASGPCTVAYGADSVVDVAKEVVDWAKKIKALSIKAAYVDGQVYDENGVKDLSKMPNRAELQATIVRIAQSPAANLAGAVASPAANIAGCIKTIIEKGEAA